MGAGFGQDCGPGRDRAGIEMDRGFDEVVEALEALIEEGLIKSVGGSSFTFKRSFYVE